MNPKISGISLFSGAGGLDLGFARAGVKIVFANELDHDAVLTYCSNEKYIDSSVMHAGDIRDFSDRLRDYAGAHVIFGGPPCQGFSVAGKMDPDDARSQLIWHFMDVVEKVRPRLFVMENVKALAKLSRWTNIRTGLSSRAKMLGYGSTMVVLNASHFGVPQARERFFFVGVRGCSGGAVEDVFRKELIHLEQKPPTVREALSRLPKYGNPGNEIGSTAAIRLAKNPVLRSDPYKGALLFNGRGRPINLNSISKTLPAQMGGNHTPIIDQRLLDDPSASDWVAGYLRRLKSGEVAPLDAQKEVPEHLRRLSVREAAALQGFPVDFNWKGSVGKRYRQIGNAVPCGLAYAAAVAATRTLKVL